MGVLDALLWEPAVKKPPDIRQKLQHDMIAMLRDKGLNDGQVTAFMQAHDRILEEFLQKVDAERAGFCPKCGHSWAAHDTELKGAGWGYLPEYNPYGYEDVYQCNHYEGMGNWCGCEERSRRPMMTPPVKLDRDIIEEEPI